MGEKEKNKKGRGFSVKCLLRIRRAAVKVLRIRRREMTYARTL
jgi:hypothetical protein